MPAHNPIGRAADSACGCAGRVGAFIGSHICRGLLHAGYSVRVFDKLYTSRELVRDIETSLEIVEGDIAHESSVLAALEGMDALLHLVHTTVPGSSMSDPEFDVLSNIAASVRWLKRLPETNIRRILYFRPAARSTA
ncbi:NAD-dependent epimerase/dehydratase family protein [bacterium]|nr:NAD-dependent epimerase/dehydratase family protein [bacterium]